LEIRSKAAQKCGEDFVKNLKLDENLEDIPNSDGMKVLRNVISLEGKPITKNIVARKITEPFWNACIATVNDSDMSYQVAAVGSPGIGKTTATPILIRLLLQLFTKYARRTKKNA